MPASVGLPKAEAPMTTKWNAGWLMSERPIRSKAPCRCLRSLSNLIGKMSLDTDLEANSEATTEALLYMYGRDCSQGTSSSFWQHLCQHPISSPYPLSV